jgi:RNA polymerase sigma-70 factor (ECF subfamily)
MALVEALPEGYRQIFNLSVIENYTHAEIAAMLGISESTSRSQLARARKLLQEKICEQEKIRL